MSYPPLARTDPLTSRFAVGRQHPRHGNDDFAIIQRSQEFHDVFFRVQESTAPRLGQRCDSAKLTLGAPTGPDTPMNKGKTWGKPWPYQRMPSLL
jgi:hypothetical protein